MLWLLLPLGAGIATAVELGVSTLHASIFTLLSLVLLFALRRVWATYLLLFGFGALTASFTTSRTTIDPLYNTTIAITMREGSYAQIVGYSDQMGEWRDCHVKALVWGAGSEKRGQVQLVRGDILRIDPTQSGYYSAMASRGYHHRVRVNASLDSATAGNQPLAVRLNEWALERLKRLGLDDQTFALCSAVALARRENLDSATVENYNRCGAAHLLALSGLHVGVVLLIIAAVTYYLPLLTRGNILADILSILAIWLFALMAGAGESVLRAAWMFSLLRLSSILSRQYSSLNALFAAAALILCFDPAALYDLGFILSFSAVAAILVVGVPLSQWSRSGIGAVDFVVSSLIISLVATVATAPLISHSFGYVALLSPLSTLPLLLSITTIILCSILWILIPLPLLAPLFRHILQVAATLQDAIVKWFASTTYGYIPIRLTIPALCLCYGVMVATLLAITFLISKRRSRFPR